MDSSTEILKKFLHYLEEIAKASDIELLSIRTLNHFAAIKYLHRGLHENNTRYDAELLQMSIHHNKDVKQLLDDVLHDVWIKKKLLQLSVKLKDETLKRQILEQLESTSTNFLFVTAELAQAAELEASEQKYAGDVFMLNY